MIYQKPTKTITGAYTTTDADNGYRIICNSATAFTITLHTATGRSNFDIEINNIGSGDVTCGGQTISQYSHAHVGNTGTAWVVSIAGGNFTLNDLFGDVVIEAGDNITLDTDGNTITINSTVISGQFDYGYITEATTTAQDWGNIA